MNPFSQDRPFQEVQGDGYVVRWAPRDTLSLDFEVTVGARVHNGYLKWDGCANVWDLDEDYTHCCTQSDLARLLGPAPAKSVYDLGSTLDGWE